MTQPPIRINASSPAQLLLPPGQHHQTSATRPPSPPHTEEVSLPSSASPLPPTSVNPSQQQEVPTSSFDPINPPSPQQRFSNRLPRRQAILSIFRISYQLIITTILVLRTFLPLFTSIYIVSFSMVPTTFWLWQSQILLFLCKCPYHCRVFSCFLRFSLPPLPIGGVPIDILANLSNSIFMDMSVFRERSSSTKCGRDVQQC